MIAFSLAELAAAFDARWQGDDVMVRSVSSDSRILRSGDLFVALKGPHFDGRDYLALARQQGAAAAMVSRFGDVDLPQLQVEDTRIGLGRLARLWRQRGVAKVVAVTGSNGKTTLKEMLASILAGLGPVLATRGNLNNDIGLPLTLTRLQDEAFAVVEMGANHPGEIAYLSGIAAPDVAVLNNAGRAHLEGFGSPEGVARAKAEIIGGLQKDGVFVYNADDCYAPLWRELAAGRRMLSFGTDRNADVSSPHEALELQWSGDAFVSRFPVNLLGNHFDVELPLAGAHNRMNALAAAAAAHAVGASVEQIRQGLAALQPVAGRLAPLKGRNGARVVDDSYNANPDSVAAAIAVLAVAPGRRTLVLGDLAELGEGAAALHAEIGALAQQARIDRLLTCGELSAAAAQAFGEGANHFTEQQALIEVLLETASEEDTVLVKGSRSSRMDRVVLALQEEGEAC